MTLDPSLKSAISLGPPKEAALYFHRVFPFDMTDTLLKHLGFVEGEIDPNAVPYDDFSVNRDVIESLIGNEASSHYNDYATLCLILAVVRRLGKSDFKEFHESEEHKMLIGRLSSDIRGPVEELLRLLRTDKLKFPDFVRGMAPIYTNLVCDAGYVHAPTWNNSKPPSVVSTSDLGAPERYVLSLRSLDLIDVDRLSWEMIVELRKDKSAMAELRDFRLFFNENFKDASPEYIQDKLLSLHARQKAVAKVWGMETIQRSIGVMLDQNTAVSTSLVTAALAIIGGPAVAVGGAAIPLGRAALEIAKIRVDSRKEQFDRPLRYLSRLESLTKAG